MRTRLVPSVAAAACLVALLAGCTATDHSRADGARAAVQGTWTLSDNVDTPEVPFVAFNRDRSWLASDGCDRVYGTWRITATNRLTIVDGPHADLTCAGKGLVEAALGAETARVPRGAEQLQLRTDDDTVITLDRSTDSSVGPQDRPIGYWAASHAAASPYLSLRADDSYRLFDGCTTRTGTWKFSTTEQVRLYPDADEATPCERGDTQIGTTTRGRVDASTMALTTTDGTATGTLHRFRR